MNKKFIAVGGLLVVLLTIAVWQIGKRSRSATTLAASAGDPSAPADANRVKAPGAGERPAASKEGGAPESPSIPVASSATTGNVSFAGFRRGSEVSLPLPNGKIATGVVNLVRIDATGAVRVGGIISDASGGSFALSEIGDKINGRILVPQEKKAYVISPSGAGRMQVRELPLANVLCYPFPKEPRPAGPSQGGNAGPQSAPPLLSSRPAATVVLYLDFDGETVTDPDWPAYAPDGVTITGSTIVAPASALSNAEITEVWNRVKEDYWPFNIDVTTDPNRYNNAPLGQRMRVIITPNDAAAPGAGGVAYRGSLRLAGSPYFFFQSDNPAWVFNTTVDGVAEAISHELGHTLGLSHDGRAQPLAGFSSSDGEYYYGHGDPNSAVGWAPIMGAGYYQKLVQWSQGEYPGANNHEDDVAIISGQASFNFGEPDTYTNNTGYIADDAGDLRGTAAALDASSGTFNLTGTISSQTDSDYYAFAWNLAKDVTITAAPPQTYPKQANLDMRLELQDSNGSILASSNPDGALNTSTTQYLVPGNYYLKVSGVGRAGNSPASDYGYSNYGSVGQYSLALTSTISPLPAAVSSGFAHVMVVRTDGTLVTAGDNNYGQLGTGDPNNRTAPALVASGVATASAGADFSLFVKTDGTLWSMGNDFAQQLGVTTENGRSATPLLVASGVSTAAAGYEHMAFVKSDGTLWTAGANSSGQLGDGTTTTRNLPVQVATGVTKVAAGAAHTMFVKSDQTLWAMGGNGAGQLGDGTTTDRLIPVQVAAGVAAVGVGAAHTLFLKTDGTLWAMGYNGSGQLGDGTFTNRSSPVQVASGVAFVAPGQSPYHSSFIKTDGTLWVMGDNSYSQLGDGTSTNRAFPIQIDNGVVSAALGQTQTLFIKSDGSMWGMGNHLRPLTGTVSGVTTTPIWVMGPLLPAFSLQPANQTVVVNQSATFSALASGNGVSTYQWQRQLMGGSTWENLADGATYSGVTTSTLMIVGIIGVMNGDQFRCVATNLSGSTFSNSATLTVNLLAQSITFNALPDVAYTATPLALSATASSGLPVSFSVLSGPASVSGTSLTLTGVGNVTVRAAQAGDATYAAAPNVDRNFAVSANFAFWLAGKFTAGERADSSVSGPNADPDHDGLSNLVEYALGLEPKTAEQTGRPYVNVQGSDWVYTYTRPSDRAGLTYEVEMSTNLATWTTTGVVHEWVSTSGGAETWHAKYPVSSAANCYFRLKVSQ